MADYPYKRIRVNGIPIDEHRHVMEQHLGRKLNTEEHIHHINGDRKDNRLGNLEITQFVAHMKLHKESSPGVFRGNAKLNVPQVRRIKEYLKVGIPYIKLTNEDLSIQFNISRGSIQGIKAGLIWKDVKTTEEMYNT